MNPKASKLASLLGSASLLTMANVMAAQAQQIAQAQTAQATPMEVPEQVLITGSLIHGTAAVGVPVTNLSPQDFAQTGALTTSDLFRTVPSANVAPGPIAVMSGANIERATRVNIRGLDTGDAVRTLLLVDGRRFPGQGNGVCEIDPSIIPALALDRIDILTDGASAVYGTAAMAGVINEVLKRGYDGAVTQLRWSTAAGGKNRYLASQLWGRTWDGGDITLSYEWYEDTPIQGNFHSKFTVDFSPWGLDNRTPLASAMPGIISTGAATTAPVNNRLGTNCTNCFSIPAGAGSNFNSALNAGLGPLAPSSAPGVLNWATFAVPANGGPTNPAAGTRNEFNPYSIGWYDAAQQRNGATITVDQRLTKNISFFGEGFYSNRRAEFLNPGNLSPSSTDLLAVAVPTFNPYYPVGAPSGLRVNYSTVVENPSYTNAYELADMYTYGLNIDLPGGWTGKIFSSEQYDSSFNHVTGSVNVNAVSAALGWTIAASAGPGTLPGLATWTKPGAVPYLNLFCDARTVQCNAPNTLNYITGVRQFDERYWITEKGANFDGPLFDVPAGQVKAAVGVLYSTDTFSFKTLDSTGAPSLLVPLLTDAQHRHDWAAFTQVNIPVIGDTNRLPGFEKVDIEFSWRHDQYDDVGGTSNPKAAFNWLVSQDIGLTIRGSWGTSFRAPGYGEVSPLANNNIQAQNSAVSGNAAINIVCGTPANSGAGKLINPGTGFVGWTGSANNGTNTAGAALGCPGGALGGNTATPTGISFLGDGTDAANFGYRDFVNTADKHITFEQGLNWSFGAEFAPSAFLKGLDVQATWYSIKITGALRSFGNPTSNSFNDPSVGFAYIVPTDIAKAGVDVAGCSNNNTPQTCPEFEAMVRTTLNNGRSSVSPAITSTVLWINDGGILNAGLIKVQGIDWNVSYDWDLADFGAWNVGVVGTYYLHQYSANFFSPTDPEAAAIQDVFHTTLSPVGGVAQTGVESLPRMRYRARLGWSNGPWTITGFMDYQSHYFHTQAAPPNVNNQCTTSGGVVGGGNLPCLISGYTNIEPSFYTFDLSMGYDTGDDPANDYLKHIGVQVVVQDLTDRHSPFEYRISTGGGNPAAMDITRSNQGRTVSLILTKTW